MTGKDLTVIAYACQAARYYTIQRYGLGMPKPLEGVTVDEMLIVARDPGTGDTSVYFRGQRVEDAQVVTTVILDGQTFTIGPRHDLNDHQPFNFAGEVVGTPNVFIHKDPVAIHRPDTDTLGKVTF